MRVTLQDLLSSTERAIVADGGMGTMLFSLGLERGASPELWNAEEAEKIASVHRAYLDAGARVILTNTFGCNRVRLERHDLAERVSELNRAAAEIACAEAESVEHPAVVGGDIGPLGEMLAPLGRLNYDEAVAAFEEQAKALVEGKVDVLWIETMSALEEVQAAMEGCRCVAPDFPIVATMTFDTHGHTMMGVSPEKALEALKAQGIFALGGNCGNGPAEIEDVIAKMHAADPDVILVAKANAGIPRLKDGIPNYDGTPEIMAEYAVKARNLGARIIGACCGSTPDHIRAIADALRASSAAP